MKTRYRLVVALCLSATSVSGQNLYPNADFNDTEGIAGWSADPGTVQSWGDASDCPASGGVLALAEQILPTLHELSARGPCLAFDVATQVDVRLFYQASIACGLCAAYAEFSVYANETCAGFPIDSVRSTNPETLDWTLLEGSLDVPAGGSIRVGAGGGGDDHATVAIDEIRVTAPGYVFVEDFDGGGTCRWSSGVE